MRQRRYAARLSMRAAGMIAIALVVASGSLPAQAYRPFDGTDAAVADYGKIEVELQPFGALDQGQTKTLIAPQSVINFGFMPDWEFVMQGQIESQIAPIGHESLRDDGIFFKHVLRRGVLQGEAGPSVASEFGLLLPNVDGATFVKPSWTLIVSDRYPWGTIHLNFTANLMSDPRTDLLLDAIIEGPINWTVRPVAEVYSDSVINGPQIYSALVGAIWQINDDLAVDVAVRHAIVGNGSESEVRAGVTFAFPIDRSMTTAPVALSGRAAGH
jgi:hypothetical protein